MDDLNKMQEKIQKMILEVSNAGASVQKIRISERFYVTWLEFKSVYEKLTKGDK